MREIQTGSAKNVYNDTAPYFDVLIEIAVESSEQLSVFFLWINPCIRVWKYDHFVDFHSLCLFKVGVRNC